MNSQTTAIEPGHPFPGWLRDKSWDYTLIFGVMGLALTAGYTADFHPSLFGLILFLDLWFLGYHHVIATFTRLTFDMASFQEHKFLVIGLPIIVAIGAAASCYLLGPWVLTTVYLHWQWFHYTRQSYGIARVYQCKVNPSVHWIDQAVIYALPLAGIMYRSFQKQPYFLGLEVRYFPVSALMVKVALLASLVVIVLWMIKQIRDFKEGKSTRAYVLFVLSHLVIFTVGYIAIAQIDFGWLVLNVWHNAQYVLFVWMFNNRRFKNQIDSKHRLLSTLSLERNQIFYYLTCLGISTVVYLSLESILRKINISALPLALIVYQVINFHHYIVDGIIWKVRKKPLRQTLDLKHQA